MRTISDVLDSLEHIAPREKAASWDPVGLQLGDPGAECRVVGVCHEVTDDVIAALSERPVDLLVSYHPLLFRPTTRLTAGAGAAGRAFRLIRAGAALAVVHTAFDVAPGGAADALAAKLGLHDSRPFGPIWGSEFSKIITFVPGEMADAVADAMAAAGAGRVGSYSACSFRTEGVGTFQAAAESSPAVGEAGEFTTTSEIRVEMVAPRSRIDAVAGALVEAHPYEEPAFDVLEATGNAGFLGRAGELAESCSVFEFAAIVEDALGARCRVARSSSSSVSRVAVVPGSGRSLIGAAAGVGAHVLVTGDIGHHDARSAQDAGLSIIDPGHAPSERPGIANLYAAVSQLGETVDFTAFSTGPWEDR